jgi:hypothetical protein
MFWKAIASVSSHDCKEFVDHRAKQRQNNGEDKLSIFDPCLTFGAEMF